MSRLAPTLEAFFTERLMRQKQVSSQTVRAYRDTFRLLLVFAHQRLNREPHVLEWTDLGEPLISAFLDYLEQDRHNTPRTCNSRLAAIRALFRYAALRHPEHAALIQRVLAIPQQRFTRRTIAFLTTDEVEVLLRTPDTGTWEGRRDQALLILAVQTGLRLGEIIGLNCHDVTLGAGAHVRCIGKGRKERAVPLAGRTVTIVRQWMAERQGAAHEPLFPTRTGRRLSPDAIQRRVTLHAQQAAEEVPSLKEKHLTPHVLRHTCAMQRLSLIHI